MSSDKVNTMLVDSVQLSFGRQIVLRSAFLTSESGKVTGVLGRNGSGKSCLFRCIMGGIVPQNLLIRFNDEKGTDYKHIGNRVKYLPQNAFMPSWMTLKEAFSLYQVDYEGMLSFDPKFNDFYNMQFRELSGGYARLVEIYLVMRAKSEFCILDEPFSNIAPIYVEKIHGLIQEEKVHKGIVVSDHQYESVVKVTDDLFLISDGYTFPIKSRDELVERGYIPR